VGVKELILTAYETRKGETGMITSAIIRVGPVRMLGKATESSNIKETALFLDPIRRAWRTRQELKAYAIDDPGASGEEE
jgi:hypothetical protein